MKLIAVDFNDQYHAIRRLWGDRVLNVQALLAHLPEADFRLSVAKAPSRKLIQKFDQMLFHHDFERHYLFGAPTWQNCSPLLIAKVLVKLYENEDIKQVYVVTGSPDYQYIQESIIQFGVDCQVIGFSQDDQIAPLPTTVLTPVPLGHVFEVSDKATNV